MTPWSSILKRLEYLESKNNKTANAPNSSPGWFCMRPNCLYSEKGIANFATRKYCNGCYLQREVAERSPTPARDRRVRAQQGADNSAEHTTTEAEKKKREARTKKRKEKAEARQAWKNAAAHKSQSVTPPVPVAAIPTGSPGPIATAMAASAPTVPAASKSTKLVITDDLWSRLPLLNEALLKAETDSLAMETIPSQVEAKNPEAIFIKALGDRGPAAKVARVSELQTSIAAYKAMIVTAQESGDPLSDMEAILREKLETTEVALAKAQKDAPSQLSELKAVQESRSSYELVAQTRKDLQQKGVAKALERKSNRHELIAAQKLQLDILDAEITKMEDENNAAHATRAAALNDTDNKVLALFDTKIAALQRQEPHLPAPDGQAAAPPLALPSSLALIPVPGSLPELVAARKYIQELESKMKEGISIANQQFQQRYEEIQAEMLPVARIPEKEHLAAVGSTYEVLDAWHIAGAGNLFDWDSFDTILGPGLSATSVAQELLGDVLWKKWYPEGPPGGSAVVPQQLALIVHQVLGNIKAAFAPAKEAIAPLTEKGNIIVKDSAKRLRTQ